MKNNIMLTPGPTPLPPSVLEALARPILHHRTEAFGALFSQVLADMAWAMKTKNAVLMMTCSGTGTMESAAANLLSPGDKAVVHSTGAFGDRFASILKTYGLAPAVVSEEWGRAADPQKLEDALAKTPGAKAVFLQHTDTSTGIVNDLKTLAAVVRRKAPDAVIVVDSISGLAAEELEADAWGLDVVLAASQKGLMNAPGLGFASVSERAWKAVESAKLPRFYFDWRTMRVSLKDKETPYTPAVGLVAGQAEALRLIKVEGMESVWRRTTELAVYTRKRCSDMGLPLFPKDPSDILTAVHTPEGVDSSKLIADILREEGISIAGGQAALKGKIIRIAHMGYIRKEDLDAGFASLAKRLPAPARRG